MKKWPILFLALSLLAVASLSAQSKKTTVTTDEFTSIGLGLPATVHVVKGPHKVEIAASQDAIDKIEFKVKGGNLNIERKDGVRKWKWNDIKIYISMPNISSLSVGGSGDIIVEDEFTMGDLDLAIGGSGMIKVGGMAKNVSISIAGSGDVDASGLSGGNCDVSIAGSGDAKVGEMKSLEVSIAGSGDVGYKGEPKLTKSIAGSGGVKKI